MKNLKKPSDIYNNNKYSTTISRSFTISWICLLNFAVSFSPFIIPILLKVNHIILLSIINLFDISICIIIIVCGIIQITIKNKIFILKAYIPDFLLMMIIRQKNIFLWDKFYYSLSIYTYCSNIFFTFRFSYM